MISVLCVDNDPAILEEWKQALGRSGDMSVDPAGSVAEALGILSAKQYDAVIAGLSTGMGGIDLLIKLRNSGNAVPLIVVVRGDSGGLAAQALETGADFCLHSCGDPTALMAELRQMVLSTARRKDADDSLRETVESARIANKKLASISSATRHDINNKLTIVSGYTQLMRLENPGERVAEYITIMERAVSDISRLLKFSKEFEKIAAGPPVWQDLRAVVEKAAVPLLSPAKIGFANETTGVLVKADPLLSRVFSNLAENVIQHAGKAGAVRVHTENSGADLVLVFEDDGAGIPPEQKERIFNRGAGKNTGLGLYFAREILSVTGIGIRESGVPGRGARFEIRIPPGMFRPA